MFEILQASISLSEQAKFGEISHIVIQLQEQDKTTGPMPANRDNRKVLLSETGVK